MKSYKTTTKSISEVSATHDHAAHNFPPQTRAKKPLGLTKGAILAYITLTEQADFSEICRALGALQGEGSVSDETLFDFLATVLPDDTTEWTEMLQNRVARYATWPADTFTIVGHREKIRIRVENRVVVDVTPHENQPL